MKKFSLIVLLILFSITLNYGQTVSTAPSGSGTEADPYQISSLANLSWLTQNSGEWDKYYIQTADLDVSETATWDDADDNSDGDKYNDSNDLTTDGSNEGWFPIGNNTTKFTGFYDGNNKVISGMNINRSTTSYVGFFGFVQNSGSENVGIKNLGLKNVVIEANGFAGGFVGQNYKNTIQNCYVEGRINGNGPDGYLAGFVGYNQGSSIVEKCYADVDVISNGIAAGDAFVGGFIGRNRKDAVEPLVKECYSTGDVTVSGAIRRIGGFAGQQAFAKISKCYSSGTVIYKGYRADPQAGGFCGRSYSDEIEYSYSVGVFIGDSLADAKNRGFIGSTNNINVFTSNFLDTLASGCNASAVPGSAFERNTDEMKSSVTYKNEGWDFYTDWTIKGDNYPLLRATIIDNDTEAPTPNPMTFAVKPTAIDYQSIEMYATVASDTSGVEYYFECLTPRGHSSGWQDSAHYVDMGLDANSDFIYRVKTRDLSNALNEGAYSEKDTATTEQAPPLLFLEKDGLCAMEAENAIVNVNGDADNNGNPLKWYTDTLETNYAADGYRNTPDGISLNAAWENGTELAWEVEITTAGEYFIAVRRIAKTGGDDSGFYGVDGEPKYSGDRAFEGLASVFTWIRGNQSLGTLSAGKHTIQVRRREAGFIVDRVMIAMNEADLPEDGSKIIGMPESLPGIEIAPLSFEVAPHTISETAISMTAIDTSGRIEEYYFECLTDINHSSGWQTSATFVDSNLSTGTKYIYRVKGSYNNGYETAYSDTASATTGGELPLIFLEKSGKCVMEAERGVVIQNGDSIGTGSPFTGPLLWHEDNTESGYAGTGYMTTDNNVAINATWGDGTEISWIVRIVTEGDYYIAVRRHSNNETSSETAKPGVDGNEKAYSAFWGKVSEFTWVHGPSIGHLTSGDHKIQIRRRQDGFMVDRVMIATSLDDFPADGSTEVGPAESHDLTAIEEELNITAIPTEYKLQQNYPNPFNPATMISFTLPKAADTKLSVYNALGQKVATLVDQQLSAGVYRYKFNANNLASGVYFYKLQTKDFVQIKKMMLIK